tara:strand:- start:434 stop:688 length:255 start_codon:yes stop_codon:yes gene_type:complete
MHNPPFANIIENTIENNINFNRGIFYVNDNGTIINLVDIDSQENTDKINKLIDLSNLIFDIREKITDKEYIDIMETISKFKTMK